MTSVLLVVAITLAAPCAKDAKTDPPSLVGEWTAETAVENGRPANPPPGTTWSFTADGKSVFTIGGMGATESKYTVDAKKTPAELDVSDGPKGKALRGIYKVEADTLTLCLAEGDAERPKAFESAAASKVILITLARIKKKE